ncbi:MAG: translation initiation factor IF-2 [Atopostipes suicloacalis]|nr:translation initiation factor IF-2 [Atopostipes suicloacalis]MDN6730757.1 translation initiation factor IF-2 [Atopostipes suicloacalis]
MSKKRVYEFARELDVESKEVLDKSKEIGINIKSHMSSITEDEMKKIKESIKGNDSSEAKTQKKSKKHTEQNNKDKATQSKQKNTKQKNTKKKDGNNKQKNNKQNKKNAQKKEEKKPIVAKRTTNEKERAELLKKKKKRRGRSARFRGTRGGPAGSRRRGGRNKNQSQSKETHNKPLPESLEYTEGMTIAELALKINREPASLVKKLFMSGVIVTQNDSLSKDVIEVLLIDLGIEPIEKVEVDIADLDNYFEQELDEDEIITRPATVTIMGHVDHGKTTLLDTLRDASVVEGEAGGITQHIGAYQLDVDGEIITFLDTPGHAAFTTMRARGADVTDIVIIVVAADDGVMPQTVEAINHAKAAGVPIIVAVNKVDKPSAQPDRVKQELAEYELIPEEWGGETIFVEISALHNQNIEELLEMIILLAEIQELEADPTSFAVGSVLEARLDKSKGPVATLLVQNGTLNRGEFVVVGTTYGRIRTMVDDKAQRIQSAGPSKPVEITGLHDTPKAGDQFVVFEDEKTARQVAEKRASEAVEEQRQSVNKVTLDNLFDSLEEGELKEVNVIVKADVQGSIEAITGSLENIDVDGVSVKVVHTGVGAINETDVSLAGASNGIIIGFNVRPTAQATDIAQTENVDMRTYSVIYDAVDDLEAAMTGMLDPEYEEQVTGQATVREIFTVSKIGTIAGTMVSDGVIKSSSSIRLIRDGVVVYDGELSSLRRFDDDVKEVRKGYECGMTLQNFNDIKIDDVIEAYEMVEIER